MSPFTVLSEFRSICDSCRHQIDGVNSVHRFEIADLRHVRALLANLGVDDEQETFFLEQLAGRHEPIEVPSYIIDHLIEYLKGAIHANSN